MSNLVEAQHRIRITMNNNRGVDWGLDVEQDHDSITISFVNNDVHMVIPYDVVSELITALEHMQDVKCD